MTCADGAGPDEVGSHPASRSPFDIDDMVGNVYELTRRSAADATVVARGGSFAHDALVLQLANRVVAQPGLNGLYVGLRLCATPR